MGYTMDWLRLERGKFNQTLTSQDQDRLVSDWTLIRMSFLNRSFVRSPGASKGKHHHLPFCFPCDELDSQGFHSMFFPMLHNVISSILTSCKSQSLKTPWPNRHSEQHLWRYALHVAKGLEGNLLLSRLTDATLHLCAASTYRSLGGDLQAADRLMPVWWLRVSLWW